MFAQTTSLLEIATRVFLVYVFLLVLVRLAGKREVGELSPMEFLSMLLLSETVSPALTNGDTSLIAAGVAAVTLLALTTLVNGLTFRFPRFERLVEGRPSLLIRRGRIDRRVMRAERITTQELRSALRREGVDSPDDVSEAYVETNGAISVIKRTRRGRKRPPATSSAPMT